MELNWSIVYNLIFTLCVILASYIIGNTVDRGLKRYFIIATNRMDIDETVFGIVRRIVVMLVYFAGIVLIVIKIPFLRDLSYTLLAGAGFAGIVVGIAAQRTLSNVISGISLATFRPFRVGDLVTIHGEYGTISDITLGHTIVATWDNRRLIIPNHIISDEEIINWTIEDKTEMWTVDVGISYDSDIDKAREIMKEEANNHSGIMSLNSIRVVHPYIKEGDEIKVLVTGLNDFSVNMRIYFWVKDRLGAYTIGCELLESIKKRFDAEGIEIPYPYRTIVHKDSTPSHDTVNVSNIDNVKTEQMNN